MKLFYTFFLLMICILDISCSLTGFTKKDINLSYIFYDLDCEALKNDTMKCNVRFDIDSNYSMNEPKIILLLYDLMYHVSKQGKKYGFEYGKLINFNMKLETLKVHDENFFTVQFRKEVNQKEVMNFSYHLSYEKYFKLDDVFEMKEYWDKKLTENNRGKKMYSIRDSISHDKTGITFEYRYGKFKRKEFKDNLSFKYIMANNDDLCSNSNETFNLDIRIFIDEVKENYNPLKVPLKTITNLNPSQDLINYRLDTIRVRGNEIPLISFSKKDKSNGFIDDERIFVFKNHRFNFIAIYLYESQSCNSKEFEDLIHQILD
ncbi:MAG: hypothetical protein SFU98_07975 [Leptospiraceae bacterium]|nr:hypothetical protein [Leptospiraceae bacterium]